MTSLRPRDFAHDATIGQLTLLLLDGRCEEVIRMVDELSGSGGQWLSDVEIRDLRILRALAELDRSSEPGEVRAPATETAIRFSLRILPTLKRLVASDPDSLHSAGASESHRIDPRQSSQPFTGPHPPLSQRERETLVLTELGFSNKEIAQRMWIEEGTVKKHQSNMLRKLDARNRTEAVMKGRQLGLLP